MLLKKLLLSLFLALFIMVSYAQTIAKGNHSQIPGKTVPFPGEPCASQYMEDFLKRTDPSYLQLRNQIEQFTQQYIQNQSSRSGAAGVVYTIPIVFHIMHEGESIGDSTNISDAQVFSCIAALNRDFRRTAADGGIARSGPLGADAEIEFCIARTDPNGNYSNGITRHDMSGIQGYLDSGVYHTASTWRSDVSMKAMVQWNPAQYLNVWVVNKIKGTSNIYNGGGGGTIGYATFPGGASSKDGVVIRFSACGNDITGSKGFNLWSQTNDNRVLTHELGHYFNLFHTFQGGSCAAETNCATQGDLCCDTPPTTVGMGNNCTSPQCSGMENKENYMQYQNNACAADFTPNQVTRMRATLIAGGPRHSLTQNALCASPYQNNPVLSAIFFPVDTVCSTTVPAYIVVCNGGNDTLKSFNVKYKIDAGGVTNTYFWSGNMGPMDCDTVTLPAIVTTAGAHTYYAEIDSTIVNGGGIDNYGSDNLFSSNFYSKVGFGVLVDITTDCSAAEISWEIRDTFGVVKLSGSGYTSGIQSIFESACLDSGCYDFAIYDSWGDGLQPKGFCPSAGKFIVRDLTTGQIIAKSNNPNFGDSAIYRFCLPYNSLLIPGYKGCDTVYPGYPVYLMDTSVSFPAAYKWTWDFGDGTSSTSSNPVKKYNAIGTYDVKMIVENASMIDSVTKAGCVVVIPTPPGFCDTLDNYDLAVDTMIFYKLLGTWGYYPGHNGANIRGYAEPFNLTGPSNSVQRFILPVVQADAGSPTSSFAMNIYADNAGAPGAILSTDTILISSLVAGVSNEIFITTPPFVTGNFWAGIELEYGTGDTLVLTTANNRIGGANTTFVKTAGIWQSSNSVAAISTSSGIRVIYTDLPATGTMNVTRSRICTGQSTTFSASSLSNYDSIKWFFPGGTPSYSTSISQTVSYTNKGTYRAILYLEGICSNDSIIKAIVVDSVGATASFTESSLAICEQDSIHFNGTITGNGTIYWTFPGGVPSTSNQEDDSVLFVVPGTFNVKMKVVNGCGSDSVSKVLVVRGYPSTTTNPGDTTICDGTAVTLTSIGGTDYRWSTGAITKSISVSPSVTTNYWTVAKNANCVGDTAYLRVTINAIPDVVANASPTLICLGDPIYFSMTGSSAITYNWDFGDMNTSTIPNGNHTYTSPGTYTATLTGVFGLCDSTNTVTVVVNDCTGLDEEDKSNSIVVYPNPASNYLNMSFLDESMKEVEMSIFNSAGKMIYNSTIKNESKQVSIDLLNFTEGIYLIKFSSANSVFTKKLIIVK